MHESIERGLAQSAAGDVVDLGNFTQYLHYTWRDLWYEAWPNVPSSEASEADVALFTAHAESLNTYAQHTAQRARERAAFAALLDLEGGEES